MTSEHLGDVIMGRHSKGGILMMTMHRLKDEAIAQTRQNNRTVEIMTKILYCNKLCLKRFNNRYTIVI